MFKRTIIFLLSVILFVACEEEEHTTQIDEYHGTYMVRDVTLAMVRKQDSVLLSITDNLSYSILYYDAPGSAVEFCDNSGRIDGFGSNSVIFAPESFSFNNCDSLRIPKGAFVGDFVNHGDTIYLEQLIGDSLFQFILLP